MGSSPGQVAAEHDLRPTGQPLEGLACAGVSDTKSFGSLQPPWNVWLSRSLRPAQKIASDAALLHNLRRGLSVDRVQSEGASTVSYSSWLAYQWPVSWTTVPPRLYPVAEPPGSVCKHRSPQPVSMVLHATPPCQIGNAILASLSSMLDTTHNKCIFSTNVFFHDMFSVARFANCRHVAVQDGRADSPLPRSLARPGWRCLGPAASSGSS